MKKIELIDNEQVLHRVHFAKRSFLISLLTDVFVVSISSQMERSGFPQLAFIFFLIFFIFLYLSIRDFIRIFFHRIYITNLRLIYVKGNYFKRITYYLRSDITGVYYKSPRLDFRKNLSTFKITLPNFHKIILKHIKDGKKVADLLSEHLRKY